MKTFLSEYKSLLNEWHPTKNDDLSPERITHGSKKKVWWLCQNSHSWQASIVNRTKGETGCPYCAGKNPGDSGNEINLISYIIENSPKYSQASLAKLTKTSVATVSRWKYGARIPNEPKKRLLKIAGLNETDLENTDFALLGLSEWQKNEWIEHLGLSLKTYGKIVFKKNGEYIDTEVSKIKKMIVLLDRIGVDIFAEKTTPPVFGDWSPSESSETSFSSENFEDEEDFNTYGETIEYDNINNNSGKLTSVYKSNAKDLDLITRELAFNFSILEDYFERNIWLKKLQLEHKSSQEALKDLLINISLYHISKARFVSAGADGVEVSIFQSKTYSDAVDNINEYCHDLKELGQSFTSDYFDLISKEPKDLREEPFINEVIDEDKNIDKYLSLGERKILSQIENNERILKKQLQDNEIFKEKLYSIEKVLNELTKKIENL